MFKGAHGVKHPMHLCCPSILLLYEKYKTLHEVLYHIWSVKVYWVHSAPFMLICMFNTDTFVIFIGLFIFIIIYIVYYQKWFPEHIHIEHHTLNAPFYQNV